MSGGTLDFFGSSESLFSITFNSGTLQNSAPTPATLTMAGVINLKNAACTFDLATNGDLAIPSALSGVGGLLKTGGGMLSLGGTTTAIGNIDRQRRHIVFGFLPRRSSSLHLRSDQTGYLHLGELRYPSLVASSTVTVASNAVLQLDFDATNVVGALILNGVSQSPGLYNNASTPAYITGIGSLLVVPFILIHTHQTSPSPPPPQCQRQHADFGVAVQLSRMDSPEQRRERGREHQLV